MSCCLAPLHSITAISFAAVLVTSTATATLHSRDTQVTAFPGFCFNSQGGKKCPLMPGCTQLRTGGGGQPVLGSNLLSSQSALASPGCAPPGIRLSRAPAGFQWRRGIVLNTKSGTSDYSFLAFLTSVTHPKIINQQQPLLWRAMSPQIQPAP